MTKKEIIDELHKIGKESSNAAYWLAKLQDYENEDLAKMILVIGDAYPDFKVRSDEQYTAGLQALLIGITISLRILEDEDEEDISRKTI